MNINTAFPSTYLRHADLQGRRIVVTIERITIETMGDGENKDTKPVVYFVGAKKAMAFNKTNALELAMAFGDETDNWIGKQIEVFPSMTRTRACPRRASGAGRSTRRHLHLLPLRHPPPWLIPCRHRCTGPGRASARLAGQTRSGMT